MGRSMNVDTSIELCAGNEIVVPGVERFKAMRKYNSKKAFFDKVREDSTSHLYHMGGKDACQVKYFMQKTVIISLTNRIKDN